MIGLDALLNVGGKLIDKLIPDPEAKAKAQLELQKMAQDGELAKMANETELYKTEQNNLTQRMQADMGSDSWLSKNIRPMTLIFLLAAYSGFAVASILLTILASALPSPLLHPVPTLLWVCGALIVRDLRVTHGHTVACTDCDPTLGARCSHSTTGWD